MARKHHIYPIGFVEYCVLVVIVIALAISVVAAIGINKAKPISSPPAAVATK